jgi:hypothetical protein
MAIPLHFKQTVSAEKLLLSRVDGRVALAGSVVENRMFTNKEDKR